MGSLSWLFFVVVPWLSLFGVFVLGSFGVFFGFGVSLLVELLSTSLESFLLMIMIYLSKKKENS